MKLRISDPAREDLLEIYEYIATENPQAAEKLLKTFKEKFELLSKFPNMGKERHEFFIGVRVLPVGNYIIIYQSSNDLLEIVRVRHGATNLESLFDIQ